MFMFDEVFEAFGQIRNFLKFDPVKTEGPVFRLHCVTTSVILFVCSIIITAYEFLGSPIECLTAEKPVNTFCWVMSTFTVSTNDTNQDSLVENIAPGVGPQSGQHKHHNYYQWVCFVLFFQGVCCYVPKWLWQNAEGGLMKGLMAGFDRHSFQQENHEQKKKAVVEYVIQRFRYNYWYVLRYWSMEFLCFFNILAQMYAINEFFNGEFMSFGWNSLSMWNEPSEEVREAVNLVFPKVTKCTFYKYGPSGSRVVQDILCVLPLNMVNEVTYLILWFWYMLLAILLFALMIYRMALCLSPDLRSFVFCLRKRTTSVRNVSIITDRVSVFDWWTLYMLGHNLNSTIFAEIVQEIAGKLESVNKCEGNETMKCE